MTPLLPRLLALCACAALTPLAAFAAGPDDVPAGVPLQAQNTSGVVAAGKSTVVDPSLLMLHRQLTQGPVAVPPAAPGTGGGVFVGPEVVRGMVRIEAMATTSDAALISELQAVGAVDVRVRGNLIVARIDATQIDALLTLKSARFIRPGSKSIGNAGAVMTQGDAAQGSQQARQIFNVDGRGVAVGVISTGYNSLGGAPRDVSTGDLPGPGNPQGRLEPVKVLKDLPAGVTGDDEGRAMLQIIHDVAPGAALSIYVPEDIVDHADGLRALAKAGARVIADDLNYLWEPWFQESPISVVQRELAAQNVTVINAAANMGNHSVEDKFHPVPPRDLLDNGVSAGRWRLHDWGNGQTTFPITLHRGNSIRLALQWDEPYASYATTRQGSGSDLDIFAFHESQGVNIFFGSAARNIGGDPIEIMNAWLPADADVESFTFHVGVGKLEGTGGMPGKLKIVAYSNNYNGIDFPAAPAFNRSTALGHNASEGGISACAVSWTQTNTVRGPVPESFSSLGGFERTRDATGAPLARPVKLQKPDVCGPDRVATTFFGHADATGTPSFVGTSAASPHLAGVAALMLQASNMSLRPSEVANIMRATAVDLWADNVADLRPGFDYKSGYGFINAGVAVSSAMARRDWAGTVKPAAALQGATRR